MSDQNSRIFIAPKALKGSTLRFSEERYTLLPYLKKSQNQQRPLIVSKVSLNADKTQAVSLCYFAPLRRLEKFLKRCVSDIARLSGGQSSTGFQPVGRLKRPMLARLVLVVICLIGLRILETGQCQDAANYRLAPNDLLDVHVYDEPDLAAQVRLAGDGTAIFPLIGSVALRGKTIPQATALLRARYMAGYLVNPQVSLIILAYAKRSFTVLGQVQKPGPYEIVGDESVSLLQAVGMAGGYTRIADPGNITVRRTDAGQEQVMRFNGRRMAKGVASPDCVVKPGDVITVGESIF
jgi:protein involved in polysaccharide export with SLBB domain